MSPIRGLILAGGLSRRMGRDKATLCLDGRTLLEIATEHFVELQIPATVSARREQNLAGSNLERVNDPVPSIGPAGGLLQVMHAHPETALLVVPVDLPDLDTDTIRQLIDQRDPSFQVTAFRSPGDGRVEPLCALYEPSAQPIIQSAMARDKTSLRRILELDMRLNLIEARNPGALMDVDTPDGLSRRLQRTQTHDERCNPST